MGKGLLLAAIAVLGGLILSGDIIAQPRNQTAKRNSVRRAAPAPAAQEIIRARPTTLDAELAAIYDRDDELDEFEPGDCVDDFESCMDQICGNPDLGGSTFECSTTLSEMRSVSRLGETHRVGGDLLTFARASCLPALMSCPLAKRNSAEQAYLRRIQTDMLAMNFMTAIHYAGEDAREDVIDEYRDCMAEYCGEDFANCMTLKDMDRRAVRCEPILANSPYRNAIKRAFYQEMQEASIAACESYGGTQKAGKDSCEIIVVLALPIIKETKQTVCTKANAEQTECLKWETMTLPDLQNAKPGKVLAQQTVRIGEVVECTQEYFDTRYTVQTHAKQAGMKKIVGAVKTVGGAALIVGGAFSTALGAAVATVGNVIAPGAAVAVGAAIAGAGVSMIGAGVGFTAKGLGDISDAKALALHFKKQGACFINGRFVVGIEQYFQITLRME
ncbi:MAG: hypothetical protein FWD15_03540 [Alphaproteobacteria bacterium]|nr:hypothetical protein [Alphaproteobacteria bacterium]